METTCSKPKSIEIKEPASINTTTTTSSSMDEEGNLEFQTIVITPVSCVNDDNSSTNENAAPTSLEEQLKEAQLDAKRSADALEDLVLGIRAVKRILDRSSSSSLSAADDTPTNDNSSNASDEELLSKLSERLHGVLGSDLLALANAANMAREHSKLASEEASLLVVDINKANEEAETATTRAHNAEKVARKLYKENVALRSKAGQLRAHRKTLVKEVKVLRQAVEEKNRDLLERRVLDSMSLHERILKTPNSNSDNGMDFETSETPTTPDRGASGKENNKQGDLCNQESITKDADSTEDSNDSPLPSLGEATGCSEDSSSYEEVERSSGRETPEVVMPQNVSFATHRGLSSSPLHSPDISPPNINDRTEMKPICDPSILRKLAMPCKEIDNGEAKMPAPRSRVTAAGLYEC